MELTYLYTKLQITLSKLALVALLEKHDKGLEALAEDIGRVVMNQSTAGIYLDSALLDYLTLAQEEMDFEFDEGQIEEEFEELLENIFQLLLFNEQRTNLKFRAIHLELPNILIIEYGNPRGSRHVSSPEKPTVIVRRRSSRRTAS